MRAVALSWTPLLLLLLSLLPQVERALKEERRYVSFRFFRFVFSATVVLFSRKAARRGLFLCVLQW